MPQSDEELRKVTLNLYKADVEWLEKTFGQGWTAEVRSAVRFRKRKYEDARRGQ